MILLKSLYQSILITFRIVYSWLFYSRMDHKKIFVDKLKSRRFEWKKEKKLKILIVTHVNNWESILVEGLGELGEVEHFEWSAPANFFESKEKWDQYYQKVNEDLLAFFKLNYSEENNYLIFIYASDFSISSDTVRLMKKTNVMIVSFCWDDLLYFEGKYKNQPIGVKELCQAADLNLTFSPEAIYNYERFGAPCVFWDSEELDVGTSMVPEYKKISQDFYVLFIGSKYGWRGEFIERLVKKGVTFKCFGKGWDSGSLTNGEMVEEIKKAPLTLGFSNIGYTKRHTTIKGRDFEVPLWGGLYITQDSSGIERFYKKGNDLLVYRNLQECYEKILYIKNNPEVAREIRRAGILQAQKKATWKSRFLFLEKLMMID